MVTQRTEGLYRLFLLGQIIIVALLFWFGVCVIVTFYSPGEGARPDWKQIAFLPCEFFSRIKAGPFGFRHIIKARN